MAEKKESKPGLSIAAFEIVVILIILIGGATIAYNWIAKNSNIWKPIIDKVIYSLINFYSRFVIFSIFLTVFLFVLLIIYIIKENKIRNKVMENVLPKGKQVKIHTEDVVVENPKWKLVEQHINSEDASKWRLAILEADIVLADLLESLQLHGESIGDKLKTIEPSDFLHLEQAWEAHKIRNAIAHQGSDFLLTEREAKRVIKLYQLVFEEFKII